MRGHNRPPYPPKIPGTDLPSWDVPTAIIYRPARSAMTSAPRPNYWVLEFEPSRPPQVEPLDVDQRIDVLEQPADFQSVHERAARDEHRAVAVALEQRQGFLHRSGQVIVLDILQRHE